ncbi:MAG: N-acetylmuramoyl-L-alanine amidase [Gammaproteobacteria bacterium]|nr:N-acetylmuramoyl-L-alanine amidase [Gammaproteobacteria bacterium]
MPGNHIVQQGENLTVIARKYGFPDWRVIYNHPNNQAFRKRRPDPNKIFPGDQIFIPNKTAGPVTPPPLVEFDLAVRDTIGKGGFPNLTLRLKLPSGTIKEVITDAHGAVEVKGPGITLGKVDILEITDKTATPWIGYPSFAQTGLTMDKTHILDIPNKRKLINGIMSKHNIVRRGTWGAKTPNYSAMDEDWDYATIVIHHSGNGGAKIPAEIEKKHMAENHWDDVGYHFLIPPDGKIHEGRYLTFKGSHVEKANTGKIGILVMGDFEHQVWDFDDDPTAAQLAAAEALINTLKTAFPTVTKLGGHRDYKVGTECPGGELYKKLPGMRTHTQLGGP